MSSCRDVDVYEVLSVLAEQVARHSQLGTVVLCGDFNARCSYLQEGTIPRTTIKGTKNEQGEILVEFLMEAGLCLVNGRKGEDNFTCISSKGRSVVDFCIVSEDDLDLISEFQVKTMSDCEDLDCANSVPLRVPDHSILLWSLRVVDSYSNGGHDGNGIAQNGPRSRLVIPSNYLADVQEPIQQLIVHFGEVGTDQTKLDEAYDELVKRMTDGLVEVRIHQRKSQVWYTKELAELRRMMRKAESQWLHSSGEVRKEMRVAYLDRRRVYSKAVRKAKKGYEEQLCHKLEENLGSSSFWKEARKIGLCSKKHSANLKEVLDDDDQVRSGNDAVDVWKSHFQLLLGGDVGNYCQHGAHDSPAVNDQIPLPNGVEISEKLGLQISQEEVDRAIEQVKKSAACGKDGVSAEMMLAQMLKDVWLALFRCCWEGGVTPTMWRTSLLVPVPKKRCVGVCTPDMFRGIALTSVVYKVFCMILNERLSKVADEFHLLPEEQGGFRKGRGCQDQILTLLLIAQSNVARKKEGCLTAFIDFSKAYDRVHRDKLWLCLENQGVNGKFLEVLQSLYMENCMQVKVYDQLSDNFPVDIGLRQGCVLSPLLFSLYINGLIDGLKQKRCGMSCGGTKVPGLLYADDTSLFGEDANGLQQSLCILEDWCKEWGMKVNIEKSAVIHFRRRSAERCRRDFIIGGEVVPLVSTYKYLGCYINEFLDLNVMVADRVEAGRKAASLLLQQMRSSVGMLFGQSFKKLFDCMVQSVVLYGSEAWGCNASLSSLDHLQLRVFRSFLGVARSHPRVSLFMEMDCLPLYVLRGKNEMCKVLAQDDDPP
jgi:hypothetical protein